jgi:hypothetical protein
MRPHTPQRNHWAQLGIGACALLVPPLTLGAALYSMLASPDEGTARPAVAAAEAQAAEPEPLRGAIQPSANRCRPVSRPRTTRQGRPHRRRRIWTAPHRVLRMRSRHNPLPRWCQRPFCRACSVLPRMHRPRCSHRECRPLRCRPPRRLLRAICLPPKAHRRASLGVRRIRPIAARARQHAGMPSSSGKTHFR